MALGSVVPPDVKLSGRPPNLLCTTWFKDCVGGPGRLCLPPQHIFNPHLYLKRVLLAWRFLSSSQCAAATFPVYTPRARVLLLITTTTLPR